MLPFDVLLALPNLQNYEITSVADENYNCFAWTIGDTEHWMQPDPDYYWPDNMPMEWTLSAYIEVYKSFGYMPCVDGRLEDGIEKIAIYVDALNRPAHAAVQRDNGTWASKLGVYEDIEHGTTEELQGMLYGRVALYLGRPRLGHI